MRRQLKTLTLNCKRLYLPQNMEKIEPQIRYHSNLVSRQLSRVMMCRMCLFMSYRLIITYCTDAKIPHPKTINNPVYTYRMYERTSSSQQTPCWRSAADSGHHYSKICTSGSMKEALSNKQQQSVINGTISIDKIYLCKYTNNHGAYLVSCMLACSQTSFYCRFTQE